MTARPLQLLTIGHSYAVALNRRLPHEVARVLNENRFMPPRKKTALCPLSAKTIPNRSGRQWPVWIDRWIKGSAAPKSATLLSGLVSIPGQYSASMERIGALPNTALHTCELLWPGLM